VDGGSDEPDAIKKRRDLCVDDFPKETIFLFDSSHESLQHGVQFLRFLAASGAAETRTFTR
jgi:hypothetical protein